MTITYVTEIYGTDLINYCVTPKSFKEQSTVIEIKHEGKWFLIKHLDGETISINEDYVVEFGYK